jgi:hypothetical protein
VTYSTILISSSKVRLFADVSTLDAGVVVASGAGFMEIFIISSTVAFV